MILDWPLYLGLLTALAVGFLLGRSKLGGSESTSSSELDQNYFTGLNYLLNEQPDKAVDTFVQALEVNSDTLETHLALGNLLRRRGEVDKAVRIHQNLLARPGLSLEQMHRAQYELALDYVKSGLFDRAEELLKLLVKKEGPYKIDGLKQLLEIYQDEKEWLLGLDVLKKLSGTRFSRHYEKWSPIKAHFFCELAESCLSEGDFAGASEYLQKALVSDRNSVRALILQGQIDIYTGSVAKGLQSLQKVAGAYEDYTAEVLPHILNVYRKQSGLGDSIQYLMSLNERVHNPDVLIAIADLIEKDRGGLAAAEFVTAEAVRSPTVVGLQRLLEYYINFSEGKAHEYLSSLKKVMDNMVVAQSSYQCSSCGFNARSLHWLCPSCKTWGSFKFKKAVSIGEG